MAHIVLINPRFEASYWGLEHTLPLFDARANLPVACLPLLAALTPADHKVILIDENVETIDYELCARADIVGLTGMIVQRFRMREILDELKRRGCFVAIGGPWITVCEDYFGSDADVAFIGEAEESWPRFLDDWVQGRHAGRYEQAERTDMTSVPAPPGASEGVASDLSPAPLEDAPAPAVARGDADLCDQMRHALSRPYDDRRYARRPRRQLALGQSSRPRRHLFYETGKQGDRRADQRCAPFSREQVSCEEVVINEKARQSRADALI
jgi:hypothetical protein